MDSHTSVPQLNLFINTFFLQEYPTLVFYPAEEGAKPIKIEVGDLKVRSYVNFSIFRYLSGLHHILESNFQQVRSSVLQELVGAIHSKAKVPFEIPTDLDLFEKIDFDSAFDDDDEYLDEEEGRTIESPKEAAAAGENVEAAAAAHTEL